MKLNYYEILGISYESDTNEINNNIEKLFKNSLIHQTDQYREEIYLAYETLSDETKRKEYNKILNEEDILSINKNYELLKRSKNLFDNLNKYIDKKIKVEYLWDNKLIEEKDTLESFSSFGNLQLGKRTIPFIGKASGVVKIIDVETGSVLYNNENITLEYSGRTQGGKTKMEAQSWGICIAYKHYDNWLKKINGVEEVNETAIKL